MIRLVEHKDATEIAAIYNYFIAETVITFEEDELSETDFIERFDKITPTFPWIVYEENGEVLGYAYAGTWRERVAYRFSVETSVYLHPKAKGKGLGRKLYEHLFNELKEKGMKQAIGGITLPNSVSEEFHLALGFKKVAHFKNVGFKFNAWHDVGFYQKEL